MGSIGKRKTSSGIMSYCQPTLDLSSQAVFVFHCSSTILASGGFWITLATLKPTVAYPRPACLTFLSSPQDNEVPYSSALFGQ